MGPQYRDPEGLVTATASINSTALQVGDCIVSISDQSAQIGKLQVAPCSSEHEAEVYAIGTSLPNDTDSLEAYCTAQFQDYIGIDWNDSQLQVTYIHSNSTTTDTTDVQCIVYQKGVMVSQSYKGSQQ